MEMNILIDLSWIRKGNLYTGIAKYAYRFLEYIVKHHLEKHFILLGKCNRDVHTRISAYYSL